MHPDWQLVERLLVVSLLEQDNQSVLHQILSVIQRSLPQIHISVLTSLPFSVLPSFPDSLPNAFPGKQDCALDIISPSFPFSSLANHAEPLIQILKARSFDAAIVVTLPQQSPYLVAYCCYLAGIPIRVGQSCEFSGGVLSYWVKPPIDPVNPLEYQLHLLQSAGFAIDRSNLFDQSSHSAAPDSVSAPAADVAIM
jgi:hypothetical protein